MVARDRQTLESIFIYLFKHELIIFTRKMDLIFSYSITEIFHIRFTARACLTEESVKI